MVALASLARALWVAAALSACAMVCLGCGRIAETSTMETVQASSSAESSGGSPHDAPAVGSCAVYCLKDIMSTEVEDKYYSCKDSVANGACSRKLFEILPRCPYDVRWQENACDAIGS
eukprot:TRINITY_DN125803_c0_g1_i1.p2 TRINITY_DN125803_c0_g1~~TRINITY_DN125803_c0_g1_i1.p2  ORF type:complete len:118 (-),score=22.52 TRINITY_DN125803_c0_g1_i1:256-609(-)